MDATTSSDAPSRDPYVDRLLAEALGEIERRRIVPTSTYRIQLHSGFRFDDARAILPYLTKLGITDLYVSPYLKAAPGSMHGYDVVDHSQLNPEIGTEEDHEALLGALRDRDMGLLLDVVPNHMGILGNENTWWNDVLENGQASVHAGSFDIDWSAPTRPENRGRVLLPLLGDLYGNVLEAGDLKLGRAGGSFHVQYFDHRFPLDPGSYHVVLEHALGRVLEELGEDAPAALEYQSILTAVRNLPSHSESEPARVAERHREKEVVKRRLGALLEGEPSVARAIDDALDVLDGDPSDPRSFDALDSLLEQQPYRLAYWRVAADEINYRRFFDINALAALRADRWAVVRETHRKIFEIVERMPSSGLRIDHPDGLLDPRKYLERLQEALLLIVARRLHAEGHADAPPWEEVAPALRRAIAASPGGGSPRLYVVVEKILAFDESLPEEWPTHGTSGYDALNRMNMLFVDGSSETVFTRQYEELIDDPTPYRDLVLEKKRLILDASLSSELHVLAYQLERIASRDRRSRDFTGNLMRTALREVIAAFPVYRSYMTSTSVSTRDRELVARAVRRAKRLNPLVGSAIFDFVSRVLIDRDPDLAPAPGEDEGAPSQAGFAGKFQQVTAPVTAKGIEDTTFYVYNRLVSLNEVGGEPDHFGASPTSLHRWFGRRAERNPYALSALSTHDTKRSEDVRARINVLSEIPDEWFDAFVRWTELNIVHHRALQDGTEVPGRNEEYLLYQILLGTWPIGTLDDAALADLGERVRAFMLKATREAKVHTSWQNPSEDYEAALDGFVDDVLDRRKNAAFFKDFLPFQERIARHGRINGMAQSLMKVAGPGVPDTYQGTELWDFSLVDPDNRRPVDYALRERMLDELIRRREAAGEDASSLARELSEEVSDGRGKLYLHWRALHARRGAPRLFAEGEYTPLAAAGPGEACIFAFQRRLEGRTAVAALPRLTTRLRFEGKTPLGEPAWGKTVVRFPAGPPRRYRDVFTGAVLALEGSEDPTPVPAAVLFRDFPVSLLMEE